MDDTADASTSRRMVRVILALGIVTGIVHTVQLARLEPAQIGLATDVYYYAATQALAGGDFYVTAPPGHPGYYFMYAPVVVLSFIPFAILGDPTYAYALWTAVNLLTVCALGIVMIRAIETAGVALTPLDRLLVFGYAGGSAGAASTILQGQVNLQLTLAIAAGVLFVERGREAPGGIALGIAAFVKLFPALVGAWLLRRRAWRAILAATGVGLGLGLTGLAVFGPDTTTTWLTVTLSREASVGTFAAGPNPDSWLLTVRRQLSVLAPWIPAMWLLPASIVFLAPVVLAAYRTFDTYRSRLVGLQATLLAMLVVFPLEPFYLSLVIFPTVPLLYLIDREYVTTRRLFLVGALVASVPVWLATVERVTEAAPLSPEMVSTVLALARGFFAFALPQMYGVWLMLGACVLYQHRVSQHRLREHRAPGEGQTDNRGPPAEDT